MKVYLAAQYKQKNELREYADSLRADGHAVVAEWLKEPYDPNCALADLTDESLRQIAEQDCNDIRRADVVMSFTVPETEATKRGGRHVEFGYALAFDKRLIVVGPKENIFHHLGDVEVYPDFDTARQALCR